MPKKIIAYIIGALLIIVYAVCPHPHSDVSPFIAPFLHANIAHLAINIYVLGSFIVSPLIPMRLIPALLVSYTVSVIAFALSPSPAVGISGLIYALFAIILSYNICKRNLIVCAIFIAFSLLPNVATAVHLYSLLLGFLYGTIRQFLTPNS